MIAHNTSAAGRTDVTHALTCVGPRARLSEAHAKTTVFSHRPLRPNFPSYGPGVRFDILVAENNVRETRSDMSQANRESVGSVVHSQRNRHLSLRYGVAASGRRSKIVPRVSAFSGIPVVRCAIPVHRWHEVARRQYERSRIVSMPLHPPTRGVYQAWERALTWWPCHT